MLKKMIRLFLALFVLSIIVSCAKKDDTASDKSAAVEPEKVENVQKSEKTVVISSGDYTPWTGKELNGNGFVCTIVKSAFNEEGYDVQFQFYPWARTYKTLLDGDVDAAAYYYKSPEREKLCVFSDPITVEETFFYHLKDKPIKDWVSLVDLKAYKFGASRGYTYTDQFWVLANNGTLTVDVADSDLANFRKLIAGRVELFPCESVVFNGLMRANFSEEEVAKIDYNKKPLLSDTGHLLFLKENPKSAEYLIIFNKGLKKIKDSGFYGKTYQAMLNGEYSK